MFNIQKCYDNHEIYINYNEYLGDEEDESVSILEHLVKDDRIREYIGIIDLITVKELSQKEVVKIKEIHNILRNCKIENLNVISDNKKILDRVKKIIPDATVRLLKID